MAAMSKILVIFIIATFAIFGCAKQAFVLVPSFIQKDIDEVRSWAKANQITLEINQQPAPPSLGVKPGKIMNQAPNPGSEIALGDSVVVYVALKAPYDPRVAKANLEYDLGRIPKTDNDLPKLANLLSKDLDLSRLKMDYKPYTSIPNVNYKKIRTELTSLELPRELEGNVLYLSLFGSLNKVVALQATEKVNPKKLLNAINEFEEQRHLFNQLLQ